MRSHSSGGRLCSGSLNPPTPALFTSISRRPNVLSTRVAAYSSWCSTVTSQGITSVLPPASTMARAVSSSVDFVRPSSTAVAPRAASLRAIAEPIPRPAPVTTDTCPARGCLVSIPLIPPGTIVGGAEQEWGTSTFPALRILTITIKRRTNGNPLAFGRRGTYNPASREKGSAASSLQSVQPLLSRGHLPGSRCIPKQDPNANAVQSECSLK